MKARTLSLAACGLLLGLPAYAAKLAPAAAPAPFTQDNPFASQSSLPYHLPPFDKIKDADFRPAFEAGMAEQRKEADAVAHNAEAPTFDNTIVPLERSGLLLGRVAEGFVNLTRSNT